MSTNFIEIAPNGALEPRRANVPVLSALPAQSEAMTRREVATLVRSQVNTWEQAVRQAADADRETSRTNSGPLDEAWSGMCAAAQIERVVRTECEVDEILVFVPDELLRCDEAITPVMAGAALGEIRSLWRRLIVASDAVAACAVGVSKGVGEKICEQIDARITTLFHLDGRLRLEFPTAVDELPAHRSGRPAQLDQQASSSSTDAHLH